MRSLICLVVLFAVSNAFLEIDDLRRMVTDSADRNQLRILEKDTQTPRSGIKAQVDAIVAKQPASVQSAYQAKLAAEEAEDEREYQREIAALQKRGASAAVLDAMAQIRDIEQDMSLSRSEASTQIKAIERQLKSTMSRTERKQLDSFGSDSADDD